MNGVGYYISKQTDDYRLKRTKDGNLVLQRRWEDNRILEGVWKDIETVQDYEGNEYTKEKLLADLKSYENGQDIADNHIRADRALLRYINDKDITEAFEEIRKWYE